MPATRPMDRRPGAPEPRPGEASKQGVAGQPDAERSGDSRADAALEWASRALSALDPDADGEVGTRLQELRDALARGAADGDPRAKRLLSRLDAMAFQPGRDGGPELAALNRMSHVARQLALLAISRDGAEQLFGHRAARRLEVGHRDIGDLGNGISII